MGGLGEGGVIDTNVLIVAAPSGEMMMIAGAGSSGGGSGGRWGIRACRGGGDVQERRGLVVTSGGRHGLLGAGCSRGHAEATGQVGERRRRVDLKRQGRRTPPQAAAPAGPGLWKGSAGIDES